MSTNQTSRAAAAQPPVYDAVIVGAGPAGSSIAAWLARQGWHVLLLERDQFPRHKVCGEFLSPEAQNSLRALGLYDAIAALDPIPLAAGKLTAHTGRTLEITLPGDAWGVSRYAMDIALATAAEQQGAEVWTGTTVSGWQEGGTGGGTEGETENGGNMVVQIARRQEAASAEQAGSEAATVQARAVVMACGRHPLASLLPEMAAQRANHAARNPSVGIKYHYANVSMPARVELYLFDGGYVGVNPVEDGSVNVCALASYDTFARAGRSPAGLIEAAAQWNPAFGERLRGARILPDTECTVAAIDIWRAARPWAGVPLLGDTAAMIAPLCGDGMAMALRSAEMCGPMIDSYLRSAYSWQEMGAHYSERWHSEFGQRLRIGRVLETILKWPPTISPLFRAGANLPSLADYFVRATRGFPAQTESAG